MHADLIEILRYWQSICPAGGVPHRDDLSPADIARLLPGVYLLERQSDGDMLVRLVGTELAARFGRNMTDRSVLGLMHPDVVGYYRGLYNGILDTPAGALVSIESDVEGSEPAKIEFLHLPMRIGNTESPELIFGIGAASHPKIWQVNLGGTLENARRIVVDWIDIGSGAPENAGLPGGQFTIQELLADK